jgi:hypothetical protein
LEFDLGHCRERQGQEKREEEKSPGEHEETGPGL